MDGAGPPPEVAQALDTTIRQRDTLLAERDTHAAELQALREEASVLQDRLRAAQTERAAADAANAALQEELAAKKVEGERYVFCVSVWSVMSMALTPNKGAAPERAAGEGGQGPASGGGGATGTSHIE